MKFATDLSGLSVAKDKLEETLLAWLTEATLWILCFCL